ncbi:MAG: hypothetical protein ACI8PZ_006424 [Myxococcota bacterium]|jgi:hypothetical protein
MRWLVLALVVGCGGGGSAKGGADSGVSGSGEICDNLFDDDDDGLADCADDDCAAECVEVCDDGVDNDRDGLADCADDDCADACPELCDNGVDDDGDGAIDCVDPDCDGLCVESCADGRDNDGDGAIDCDDDECFSAACPEVCGDGLDNDADGALDCEDLDCTDGCPEDCGNGIDDDGDGLLDCRDDECDSTCDSDGDGHDGLAYGGDDCDDADPEVNPDVPEVCDDGVDQDCAGGDRGSWYADRDGDGYGDAGAAACVEDAPAGHVRDDTDCDDTDPGAFPGAEERCNGRDDDCDTVVPADEADMDGDGTPACDDPDDDDPDVGGERCWVFDGAEYTSYQTNNVGYPLVTGLDATSFIEDDITTAGALVDFHDPLEPPYVLTFEYSTWDDDGSDFALYNSADGFAVQLFKDTSVYASEPLPVGGTRGVINEGTGVVVHLPIYERRRVFVADGAGAELGSVDWPEVYTHGDWRAMSIEVTDDGIRVSGDGRELLVVPGPFDTSFRTLAISAATGGSDAEHRLRTVCMERL